MVNWLKFHPNWFGSQWLFLHKILLCPSFPLGFIITYAIWWMPTLLHHESMHLLAWIALFSNQTSNLGSGGVESFRMSYRTVTAKGTPASSEKACWRTHSTFHFNLCFHVKICRLRQLGLNFEPVYELEQKCLVILLTFLLYMAWLEVTRRRTRRKYLHAVWWSLRSALKQHYSNDTPRNDNDNNNSSTHIDTPCVALNTSWTKCTKQVCKGTQAPPTTSVAIGGGGGVLSCPG